MQDNTTDLETFLTELDKRQAASLRVVRRSALETARQGGFPPDVQRDYDALIATIESAGDSSLPDNLEALRKAMPLFKNYFLEYACDTLGAHDLITQAFQDEDWPEYVKWHKDGVNIFAFETAMMTGFSGPSYWRTLTSLYTMDHNATYYASEYAEFYNPSLHTTVRDEERRDAMTADELLVYDALPPIVRAYRGATLDNYRGMSWTLELSVAESFAKRTGGEIFTAEVPREAIFVYYAERQEAEILVNPDYLSVTKA